MGWSTSYQGKAISSIILTLNLTEPIFFVYEKFQGDAFITRATALGPFLNFSVQPTEYIRHTLIDVHNKKDKYGMNPDFGQGKTVTIDYSSPNIAKPFHAGHLRSTILGNFVKQIHLAMGYNVIGINYLGDWGKQYGK
jgi:arginyl-tRNA synthetase